jgi:8-oxo-dGTP pyrophosphatase MutT (NUDIX family)
MNKTAAGLIIFTKIPKKGLVAILSRRGEFDYEEFKPQNYPNLYEVTAGGGIESGEHLIEGLLREAEEELGSATAKLIRHYAAQLQNVGFYERTISTSGKTISIYTYAVFIPHFPVKLIKPQRSSAGIKIISAKELPSIRPFPYEKKKEGAPKDDGVIWMLPDYLEGIKKGFELYKHL